MNCATKVKKKNKTSKHITHRLRFCVDFRIILAIYMYVEEMFFTRTTNRKRYRKISLFQPLSIVYKLLYIKSIIGVYLLPIVQILQFPVFINQFCMENIG